jgi:hypothetical protein
MSAWQAVRFHQARHVAQLMQVDEDALPQHTLDVHAGYAEVRARGDLSGAIGYLAHALPQFEAAAWAAYLLDGESRVRTLALRDQRALDTAMRWTGKPTDAHRRAAYAAAQAASARSPERSLGFAVFHAAGSIAAVGSPPISPPPMATARYVAGAITQAGYRGGAHDAFFERALRSGEAVAERGAAALLERAA